MKNPTLRILIFILFLLPAVVVVNIYDLNFLYFAVYAIVVSILFPIYLYTLDQSAVDFWYYTLGILGVVILFTTQTIMSKTYGLSGLIIQATERSNFLEELKDDVHDTLVNKNGHNMKFELSELLESRKAYFENLTQQCEKQLTQSALQPNDNSSKESDKKNDKESDEKTNPESSEKCRPVKAAVSAIEKLKSPHEFEENILDYDTAFIDIIFEDKTFNYKEVNFAASAVARLFNPLLKNQAIDELNVLIDKKLDARNDWLVAKIFDIEKGVETTSNLDKLLSAMWPYLLCIALSMKLARNRYIERL